MSEPELRLWLIRHAPVAGPRDVIHPPEAPADLGDAERIAALRDQLPAEAPVFASPAQRTLDTAQALGLDPIHQPDFREQGFGEWTGRTHADLEAELGLAYATFWRSPARRRPPGGESFVDQIERVRRGLVQLPAGDAVLVVHSGTIRAILAIALDLTPESALRFVVAPLSLTRIDRVAASWRIRFVNRR
ncbi:histidine phosphatase family protein [Rhodoplanes sp. TEM]|uniref:Histidine phosphatase family protein n=1 Tax=Rhodoplanes tepidamans TaxID=200616 RepID=A0ABT5JJC1_RHOTP|nr:MULTISPECIES: histidine phosphatase family protein [Rhodoplanes]MDC7789110.1 histidine phosphatase family protein [Rhodoplanes tepidamans]MDC7982727.1 histidine phosphatase family protein [Rhodoplanes sp. TEM]MDQ0357444.1 alpha-ribazole phosphatase [Rhodoplanes tepidamans]